MCAFLCIWKCRFMIFRRRRYQRGGLFTDTWRITSCLRKTFKTRPYFGRDWRSFEIYYSVIKLRRGIFKWCRAFAGLFLAFSLYWCFLPLISGMPSGFCTEHIISTTYRKYSQLRKDMSLRSRKTPVGFIYCKAMQLPEKTIHTFFCGCERLFIRRFFRSSKVRERTGHLPCSRPSPC